MRRFLTIALLLTNVVLVENTLAETVVWTEWGTITELESIANPSRIVVYGPSFEPPPCPKGGYPVVFLEGDDALGNGKEIYSMLLAAQMAGREVQLFSSSCSSSASQPGYAVVNAAKIK